MECNKCGKHIAENESYYCWTISIERYQGNTVQTQSAEVIKIHCMECGPAGQEKEAEAMRAAAN